MKILVKSHKRKGRIVRAHGRIKKENKLKKKALELVEALGKTTRGSYNSLSDAISEVRGDAKKAPFPPNLTLTQAYNHYLNNTVWHNNMPTKERKKALVEVIKDVSGKSDQYSMKKKLNSKFPYSK